MCGVAGFVTTTPASGSVVTLGRMTEAIRHRGPDDFGFYHDEWAHLGHRRLSIVDLAGGHQPMANETSSLWITYNGEIYNHAELRPALEQAGHRYQTRCDTETILHAYEQHGPDCLALFRGMFAFAIWDSRAQRLFCARDRLGIKPFYYYWDGRLFAFASEIKALLEHPAISPALDEDLLPEFLAFGYASGERTLFSRHSQADARPPLDAGLERIQRSSRKSSATGMFRRRRLRQPRPPRLDRRDPPAPGRIRPHAPDERRPARNVPERRRRFERHRGAAQAIHRRRGQDLLGRIPGDAFSELAYAARVARAIGTEHHEIVIGIDDFFDALPRLIWHEDEPIAWPSSVSLYFVSKLASEQVKVVLTGEGSDELFAGYERYRWHLLNQRAGFGIPRGARRAAPLDPVARRHVATARPSRFAASSATPFSAASSKLESLFLDNFYCAFSGEEQVRLLARGAGRNLRTLPRPLECASRTPRRSPACCMPTRKRTWSSCS